MALEKYGEQILHLPPYFVKKIGIFFAKDTVMKHKKKPRIKKLIPPHLRIPFECGTFTHTANKLYDLIFSFGLGGCWMSNHTISHKIRCSVRSVQYARQQLVKQQAIITARTCPRTWIMWAGNHRAVQNCQVLLYPRRQKMDNPFYILDTEKGRFCTQQQWGAKIAPKSDVSLKDTNLLGSQKKEAVKNTQQLPLSQGSAPNPASSSGLTSNLLAGGLSIDKTTAKNEQLFDALPELSYSEKNKFEKSYSTFIALGYPPERAKNLATIKIREILKKKQLA